MQSHEMDNGSISDLAACCRWNEARPRWLANNPFGIIAFLNGADRVLQNSPEHDDPSVRGHEMLEAVQCDGPLAFHSFFVVRMTLRIFVTRILASSRRKLFAPCGGLIAIVIRHPTDAGAELVRVIDGNAISHRAYALGFRLAGVHQMDVERHDHFPDKLPPFTAW